MERSLTLLTICLSFNWMIIYSSLPQLLLSKALPTQLLKRQKVMLLIVANFPTSMKMSRVNFLQRCLVHDLICRWLMNQVSLQTGNMASRLTTQRLLFKRRYLVDTILQQQITNSSFPVPLYNNPPAFMQLPVDSRICFSEFLFKEQSPTWWNCYRFSRTVWLEIFFEPTSLLQEIHCGKKTQINSKAVKNPEVPNLELRQKRRRKQNPVYLFQPKHRLGRPNPDHPEGGFIGYSFELHMPSWKP